MKYLSVPRTDEDRVLEDRAIRRITLASWAAVAAFVLLPVVTLLVLFARAG